MGNRERINFGQGSHVNLTPVCAFSSEFRLSVGRKDCLPHLCSQLRDPNSSLTTFMIAALDQAHPMHLPWLP